MPEIKRELVQHLSVLIGAIMEDEVDQAVSSLPGDETQMASRIAALKRAGEEIAALAAAAEVVIKRLD